MNNMELFNLDLQFFAQKKGGGSASTNRNHDSKSKRLGVKKFGGEAVRIGCIIIRQRGTKFKAGKGVFLGKDHTVHAGIDGLVKYNKGKNGRTFVNVISA
jgi:large subunit ribosomal protein L27